jgi:hypothetical protein
VLRRIAKHTGGEYLPLARARGRALAAAIAASRPTPSAAVPAPSAAAPSAPATPAPMASGAQRPATAPRALRPSGTGPLLWGALALIVAALVAVLVLRRGRAVSGREETLGAGLVPRDGEEDLSPTVVQRMNITEEYLEKTVTLRERPVLSITRGPGTGQSFDLRRDSSTSIGRAKANDIVVGDVSVSSQHCRIRPEEGRFVLHDLKSTNGTYVNERKVSRHTVAEGDVIRLGETSLQYRNETSRT